MKYLVRPQGPLTGGRTRTTEPREIEQNGRQVSLALADEHPHKVRGYNPYDTVAYAKDTRKKDVWQSKPKRS
jgi:hypothetical protein